MKWNSTIYSENRHTEENGVKNGDGRAPIVKRKIKNVIEW